MPEVEINHKPMPINGHPSGLKTVKKHSVSMSSKFICGILAAISCVIVGSFIWYMLQLTPVGSDKAQLKKVTIQPGSTSTQIGKYLEKQKIIRSSFAFDIYVRLSGKNNVLKAGTYRLSPAESTQQIVEHFVKGSVDTFSVTFYPGSTLSDTTNKPLAKKQDVTSVLVKAGFTDEEIQQGLNETYDLPLFAGRPVDSDLEGYVYGETYNFNIGATVQDILKRTFSEYYDVIQDNKILVGLSKHNLNLYQGIVLASIIQREDSKPIDQKQIAQVFYTRLDLGMTLGSDPTYQYIADKTRVARDPNLDSPYNTRRFAGLPPGPISNPGINALLAAAYPADGDYLYFLSGDDGITYFAHTDAEHQENITAHCKVKCSTP